MLLTEITGELIEFPVVFCKWRTWKTTQWKMTITWQFADPNWKPYNKEFFTEPHVRGDELEEQQAPQ